MVLLFWCRLTQVVLEKRPLNKCSSSMALYTVIFHLMWWLPIYSSGVVLTVYCSLVVSRQWHQYTLKWWTCSTWSASRAALHTASLVTTSTALGVPLFSFFSRICVCLYVGVTWQIQLNDLCSALMPAVATITFTTCLCLFFIVVFLYPPSEWSETGGYYVFTFVCLCAQRKRGSWPRTSFSPSVVPHKALKTRLVVTSLVFSIKM